MCDCLFCLPNCQTKQLNLANPAQKSVSNYHRQYKCQDVTALYTLCYFFSSKNKMDHCFGNVLRDKNTGYYYFPSNTVPPKYRYYNCVLAKHATKCSGRIALCTDTKTKAIKKFVVIDHCHGVDTILEHHIKILELNDLIKAMSWEPQNDKFSPAKLYDKAASSYAGLTFPKMHGKTSKKSIQNIRDRRKAGQVRSVRDFAEFSNDDQTAENLVNLESPDRSTEISTINSPVLPATDATTQTPNLSSTVDSNNGM